MKKRLLVILCLLLLAGSAFAWPVPVIGQNWVGPGGTYVFVPNTWVNGPNSVTYVGGPFYTAIYGSTHTVTFLWPSADSVVGWPAQVTSLSIVVDNVSNISGVSGIPISAMRSIN